MWVRYIIIAVLIFYYTHDSVADVVDEFNKSYALVVGIDKYPNSDNLDDLKYAVADARAIEKYLSDQKFIVKTLYNSEATRENIISYLENNLAFMVGKNDRFVFFFAGHGHTEFFPGGNDRGYIVPYDGKNQSSTYLAMSKLRDISDILSMIRHQLFIMDSCYGGRLGFRGVRESLDPRLPDYLTEVVKRKARQILTAGGATQRVQDTGPDGHSVFTGELLKALNQGLGDTNGDGYISFLELANHIQYAATRPNQTPGVDFLNGHEQGEFIFRNPVWKGSAVSAESLSAKTPTSAWRAPNVHEIVKEAKREYRDENFKRARSLFQMASEYGSTEAKFFLGIILSRNREEWMEGIRLVNEAAQRGYVPAMEALLKYYNNPNDFNEEEARFWKQKIAEAEQILEKTSLIDPTGGEASKGDPVLPKYKKSFPISVPSGFRVIRK